MPCKQLDLYRRTRTSRRNNIYHGIRGYALTLRYHGITYNHVRGCNGIMVAKHNKRVQVTIDRELLARVKSELKEDNITFSELITILLNSYLMIS